MFAFSVALAAALVSAHALSTPSHFTSSMVLQRGVIVNLWGLDVAGAAINVNYRGLALPPVTADSTGRFSVPLPAMPKNSTPAAIIITSPTGQLTLDDTVVGDVYFCSGQRSATATGRREYLSLSVATLRPSAALVLAVAVIDCKDRPSSRMGADGTRFSRANSTHRSYQQYGYLCELAGRV